MHFVDRLFEAMQRAGNPVCVGIDPRPDELPAGFLDRFPANREGVTQALHRFGCDVIDVVAPSFPQSSFKPLFMKPMARRASPPCTRPQRTHTSNGLVVIIDGKRNDIGSTAEAYARGYLGKVAIGGAFEAHLASRRHHR